MEKTSPIYKEQYERKVKAMLEKKLSRIQRVGFAILAVIGICATIQFFYIAEMNQGKPWLLFGNRLDSVDRLGCCYRHTKASDPTSGYY
jgi:hypothetical protein